jgi:formyltetrahydrofolate deformylase
MKVLNRIFMYWESKKNKTMNQILTVQCPDQPGLIFKITSAILEQNANIVSNQEFVEPEEKIFFLRAEIEDLANPKILLENILKNLPKESLVNLAPLSKDRIAILASKESHCLGDLMLRARFDELPMEILGVISNHGILGDLTKDFHLPFEHISHEGMDRKIHEEEIDAKLREMNPEWIILAKYMRILSPEFTSRWRDKIINIHHSFLPAFVGAKPYKQAYDRGVKIIGATAHFVNEELDQGPIIAQDVIPVNHSYSPEKLALLGKDLEKSVLARAVRLVLEKRVMVWKNRTIVFE